MSTHDHDVRLADGRVLRTRDRGAADVAAIADRLHLDRFAVWGESGGGPFALACAALLPDRVVAAALVSPLAPYDAPGLDWSAGMANGAVRLHSLALAGRDALQPGMARLAEALTATGLAGFVELASPTLPRPDQAILATDAAAQMYANLREGLAQGPEGAIEDALALVASWGVDLAAVCVPVSVWSGEQDTDTRQPMPAGLPRPSPAPSCACSPTRAICRSSTGGATRSSTGSPASSATVTECRTPPGVTASQAAARLRRWSQPLRPREGHS
jgi:pimeloyl-ACP methyl ester carboxylesterase